MTFLNCTEIEDGVVCNGTKYMLPEERLTPQNQAFWIYLAVYVALVLVAGLMSGLTMGLLSLDLMTLKVMKDGGTPTEKKHAARILPIVKRHHLLLVTLLLANAGAVEAMPIFLDRISDPVTAICVSVTAVLIFGEVIPQAICTRFGLAIGAALSPVVYLLLALFFVVAWPLSKVLDCLLGKDHTTFYRRAQLKVLVDLHGGEETHGNDEHLTTDEVLIIKGALDMRSKTAKDAMLPLDKVFMLSVEDVLDERTMSTILERSHSRVPIYKGTPENIIALLLVKTIIKLDPEDATPVAKLVQDGTARTILHVREDMPLFDLLNEFQTGKGHLVLVERDKSVRRVGRTQSRDSDLISDTSPLLNSDLEDEVLLDSGPDLHVVGIITLEDVIEELIQEEIYDETDVRTNIQTRIQMARAKVRRPSDVQKGHVQHVQRSQSHPPVVGPRNRLSPSDIDV